MKAALLDTSVIIALIDRREKFHSICAEIVESLEAPLVTCEAVIGETFYLLRHTRGGVEFVLENIANGVFQLPFRLSNSAIEVGRLIRKYADLPSSFADACLIQLATEFRSGDILTLDSDFRIYRWSSNKPFRLLIDLP